MFIIISFLFSILAYWIFSKFLGIFESAMLSLTVLFGIYYFQTMVLVSEKVTTMLDDLFKIL